MNSFFSVTKSGLIYVLLGLAFLILLMRPCQLRSRRFRLYYNVTAFLLCEICDALSVAMLLRVYQNNSISQMMRGLYRIEISLISIFMIFSFKIMNTANHSVSIAYTMRDVSKVNIYFIVSFLVSKTEYQTIMI